jgi:hypothetical protein
VLPSQLLRDGNSVDMLVADTAQGYRNFLQEKQNGKGVNHQNHGLSETEMLRMIEQAKKGV